VYWIDHVVVAVEDLDAAAVRWREGFGLDSAPGGVHPAWGTGNRIVPLGPTYVELIAVLDPATAATTDLGRAVGEVSAAGDAPLVWCVGTDDLEGTASRLGLDVGGGSRRRPDGVELQWRSAGLEAALATPWRPFFISWDVEPDEHPGRGFVHHTVDAPGIAWLEVACEPPALVAWLGGEAMPVRFVDGRPGLRGFGLSTARGTIEIRSP
jgi:hypothetical protein